MDRTTANLLDALRSPGAALLLEMLEGPSTEADLLRRAHANQPTANRRLYEFEGLGLTEREPGAKQVPGRRWSLTFREETRVLLDSALALGDRVAEREQGARERAKRKTRRGTPGPSKLRLVDEPRSAGS